MPTRTMKWILMNSVVMVAALKVACNDYFVEQLKKKGKERQVVS